MKSNGSYWRTIEYSGFKDETYIELNQSGMLSILKYYKGKYSFAEQEHKKFFLDVKKDKDFYKNIEKKLERLKLCWDSYSENERFGRAFTGRYHDGPTPFFYLRHGNKSCFFVCDSLGLNMTASGCRELLHILHRVFPKIPLYYIENKQQHDEWSHPTHLLYFFKWILGKNSQGDFLLPDLFEFLEKNAYTYDPGLYEEPMKVGTPTLLPKQLLKTVQTERYFNKQEKPDNHDFCFLHNKSFDYCQTIIIQKSVLNLKEKLRGASEDKWKSNFQEEVNKFKKKNLKENFKGLEQFKLSVQNLERKIIQEHSNLESKFKKIKI